MTKKELERLVNKLINDKVPNDVYKILKYLHDITDEKLLSMSLKYEKCNNCGKLSLIRRWKDNKCPICRKVG